MGGWTQSAMHTAYLMRYNPEGLLAAAGWPCPGRDFQHFHHPRFYIVVPEELIDSLYPFLRSLKAVRHLKCSISLHFIHPSGQY